MYNAQPTEADPGSGKLLNLCNVTISQEIMKYDSTRFQVHNFFLQRTNVEQWMMAPVLTSKFSLQPILLQKWKVQQSWV